MAEQNNLTPELKVTQPEQAQSKPQASSTNRRQRRHMMKQQGILKYVSKLPYMGEVRTKLRAANIENGKIIHQQNVERNEARNAQYLEGILEGYTNDAGEKVPGLKDNWKAQGYDAAEIRKLEEAWSITVIKDKDNYRADKKKSRALLKEANASRAARQK